MEKILITGITGFIGGELAHRLISGYEVHGIAKQCRSRDMRPLENIAEGMDRLEEYLKARGGYNGLYVGREPDNRSKAG